MDNDKRFARKFEKWCKKEDIEAIRTFNEEFLKLKKVFENVLSLLQEFIEWFNNHRYHIAR